jgi:imidazole glycerol phosphate synthase subunit HisF
MRRMYKYRLTASAGEFVLKLPKTAIIRHAAKQYGEQCIWAEVTVDDGRTASRTFRVFATGEDVPDDGPWVWRNTWTDGPYVWHLFEKVS